MRTFCFMNKYSSKILNESPKYLHIYSLLVYLEFFITKWNLIL